MIKKIPIVACPIRLRDIFSQSACGRKDLQEALVKLTHTRHVYFTNSGTSSFFVILEALKKLSGKKEVVLPAYTASALIYAIQKAGLKALLCDISLDDFNMDARLLEAAVSANTLCLVGVHMFGMVQRGLKETKAKFPNVFVVEDCAQAMGSRFENVGVGDIGDISFFSFNRGKNIPTYGGGCIATGNEKIAKAVEITLKELGITGRGRSMDTMVAMKMLGLCVAGNPWAYGLLSPLISGFKELAAQEDFKIADYSEFQVKIAFSLLQKINDFSKKRYENGMKLIEGLKGYDALLLPEIPKDTEPAFNRLPVLFKDLNKKEAAEKNLRQAGIETSRMYERPLHQLFELGYRKEDFPNATYFAEHLLTFPVHPLVKEEDLLKMIEVIRR